MAAVSLRTVIRQAYQDAGLQEESLAGSLEGDSLYGVFHESVEHDGESFCPGADEEVEGTCCRALWYLRRLQHPAVTGCGQQCAHV